MNNDDLVKDKNEKSNENPKNKSTGKNGEKDIKVINKKNSFSASKAAMAVLIIAAGGALLYNNFGDDKNSEVLAPVAETTAPVTITASVTSTLPSLTTVTVTSVSETKVTETSCETSYETSEEITDTDVTENTEPEMTEFSEEQNTASVTSAPPSYEKYIETVVSDEEQYLIIMQNGISFEIAGENAELVAYDESKNSQSFSLEIPASINGYPVTRISENVFQYSELIEEVIFPSTVKDIGNYAFSGCKNLKNVIFADCEAEIGRNAFYQSGVESIDFRNSILTMKTSAFRNTHVKELTITKDLIFSGGMVFAECSELEKVIINDDVIFKQTFKGSSEFINCPELSEVEYVHIETEEFEPAQFAYTPFHDEKNETAQ